MTTSAGGADTGRSAGTVSVRELVRSRIGLEKDSWDLALIQRAEAWDQVRMRHLLDSAGQIPNRLHPVLPSPDRLSKVIRVDTTTGRIVLSTPGLTRGSCSMDISAPPGRAPSAG